MQVDHPLVKRTDIREEIQSDGTIKTILVLVVDGELGPFKKSNETGLAELAIDTIKKNDFINAAEVITEGADTNRS